jgi:cadmium resistance protein CadD (predicted permease)
MLQRVRAAVRLRILGLLHRAVTSVQQNPRTQRAVGLALTPLLLVVAIKVSWKFLKDHDAQVNAIPEGDLERNRAYIRAMTWSVAGVGVVILAAIAVNHPAHPPTSLLVAAACFALSVPLLIVLGLIQQVQADPKAQRPTVSQLLWAFTRVLLALLLFLVGFIALLWSFSRIAALLCVLGWYWGWGYLRKAMVTSGTPIAANQSAPADETQPIDTAKPNEVTTSDAASSQPMPPR